MHATPAKPLVRAPYALVERFERVLVVFRMSAIGVLLSSTTVAAARGSRVSAAAFRPSTPRPARTTSVQCGHFNYLTIYQFKFFVFGGASIAGATKNKSCGGYPWRCIKICRYFVMCIDCGKIMRRLLRDVAEGRNLGYTTTLADASVVNELQKRAAEAPSED